MEETDTDNNRDPASLGVDAIMSGADRGWQLYMQGDYVGAAALLEIAARYNHPLSQHLLADIYLRKLDGKKRICYEAAMWYLFAAMNGKSDSLAYLMSILPDLDSIYSVEENMERIVKHWHSVGVCDNEDCEK
jgi:TPR repeat protein